MLKRLFQSVAGRTGSRFLQFGGYDFHKLSWDFLRRRQVIGDSVQVLRHLCPSHNEITQEKIKEYIQDLRDYKPLMDNCEKYKQHGVKDIESRLAGRAYAAILFNYLLPRFFKPENIVETGCATGWTSSLFLLALHKNQKGRLISIDIPPKKGELSMDWSLPAGLSSGFLVPQEIRDRWNLVLGDSRLELGPVLEKEKKIDIFYHDSDHTYQHMIWEYTTAWPYLKEGGIMVSDDISWNTSFWDFASPLKQQILVHKSNSNFGALRRSS